MAKKINREAKEMTLNISSLMDILTILLLFLILSFDSQENNVTPPENITLPDSSSEQPVKLTVRVSVSPDEIYVEDQVVARLSGGQIRRSDLDKSNAIKPLLKALSRQKAKLTEGSNTVAEEGADNENEIVFFEASKGLKYELIDRVLKTAAAAGFTKFRLAVHRKG